MRKKEHQEELDKREPAENSSAADESQDRHPDSPAVNEVEESPEEDSVQRLEREKAELEEKNKELYNQYLLARADHENYRKHMIKEKQEAFDYANANLLSDLLESLDNFDRALDAAATATDVASVVEGVKMIKNQLVSMLETKYNLTGYGEKGDLFDPNIHEAIGSIDGPVAEPICSEVYLKGYMLRERVIRYAKVMVQKPDGSVASEDTGAKAE